MDLNETLKLIDAGFTADEIRALAAEKEADGEKPKEETKPVETGATEGDAGTSEMKELTDTVKKLSETVTKMQEENIKNARTGSADVHADPIKKQMDDFISKL